MSRVLSDITVKAAKPHHCWYCGELINRGEYHGKRSGTAYGDFYAMRYHPECDKQAIKDGWDEGDYECHETGNFQRPKSP